MIDNKQLEEVLETFAKDRSQDNFVKLMELVEKSVLLVPALMPENLDETTMKQAKAGKGVELPKDARVTPCLIKKESGEQALPVFSSEKYLPTDHKSPAVLAIPFFACVSMVMSNSDKVDTIVLNPFTHSIVLSKQVLEVALKRSRKLQAKTVKLTEKQFHELAHRRISYELLPVFFYEKQKEGLEQLQKEEGSFLLARYTSVYPKEIKVPYTESDFSLLTLNVTDSLQITRIDMPEKNMAKGLCCRIYLVWNKDTESIEYYTIEKAEKGNEIGRIYADRRHEVIGPVPENGAEIETIMNLSSGSVF